MNLPSPRLRASPFSSNCGLRAPLSPRLAALLASGSSAASRLELPSYRQVRAAGGFVLHQARHGPFPPDLALLDDVGPIGQPRRKLEILLREHDGQALPLERGDLLAEGLDDDGGQPLRRLVEEEDARTAHERARDGEHLLLPAREASPSPRRHPPEGGEMLIDTIDAPPTRPPGTDQEILLHAEIAEDAPVFRHPAHAQSGDLVGRQPPQLSAIEAQRTADDIHPAHGGLERGGLAGAIAAEERHHLALARLERDAVKHA